MLTHFLLAVLSIFLVVESHYVKFSDRRLNEGWSVKNSDEIFENYSYDDEDNTSEGDYEDENNSSEEEENDSLEKWRQTLRQKLGKLKESQAEEEEEVRTQSEESWSPGRRFMVAAPIPPTPPDLSEIDSIRERLKDKTLNDTSFAIASDGVNRYSVSSASNFTRKSTSNDLFKVICIMDCQIAMSRKMIGFRARDGQVDKELEEHWKNMTDVEKQMIEAIAANVTAIRPKRSIVVYSGSKNLGTMFQVFAQWCSNNCKSGKSNIDLSVVLDENISDYESDESEEDSERRSMDSPMNGSQGDDTANITPNSVPETAPSDEILYDVKVPATSIFSSLFGDVVNQMTDLQLCLCGLNITQVCYCLANNSSTQHLIKMTPSF